MDIEKEYSCLEKNNLMYHKQIDCDFDCQETLQQYSDDILRVVKCESHSQIISYRIDSNGIEIDGKTEICITYYNDKNEICYTDFDTEFTKKVNISHLSDNAFACVIPVTKYNNYRLVNQRRIDVHISLCLDISVYDSSKCPCITSCANSKLKIEQIDSADIFDSSISKIEFDEEFSISSASSPIKRIISDNTNIFLDDCKIIKDKMLIKLSVNICVLYTTDESIEDIQKAEHTFQLSKIIDVSGLNDNDIIIPNIQLSSVFLKAKNTTASSLNEIEVYGEIALYSVYIHKDKKHIVTDGYVIGHNTNCDYSQYNCITDFEHLSDTVNDSIRFKFNTEFKEVFDISVTPNSFSCHHGKLTIHLVAKALCRSLDGAMCYISSESECIIDTKDYDSIIASGFIQSLDYNIESGNEINVRLSLQLKAFLFKEKTINVLCEIDTDEKLIDCPALTLYFGKKDESLWDIAKRFSSDIELIEKENALSSNVLDTNRVLVIPGV